MDSWRASSRAFMTPSATIPEITRPNTKTKIDTVITLTSYCETDETDETVRAKRINLMPHQKAKILGTQSPTKIPVDRSTTNQSVTLAIKLRKAAKQNGTSILSTKNITSGFLIFLVQLIQHDCLQTSQTTPPFKLSRTLSNICLSFNEFILDNT